MHIYSQVHRLPARPWYKAGELDSYIRMYANDLTDHWPIFRTFSHSYIEQDRVCGFWTWLFVLSKLPELGDTIFIVLRKQPLIFLHWWALKWTGSIGFPHRDHFQHSLSDLRNILIHIYNSRNIRLESFGKFIYTLNIVVGFPDIIWYIC